ncbi:hypothetical protein KR200_001787, partial [Drosophila serrata]
TILAARCFHVASYGYCKGYRRMWAYSQFGNKCIQFDYSGCGGNDNRFFSYSECERVCITSNHPKMMSTPTPTKRTSFFNWYLD